MMPLAIGDPVPWFTLPSTSNPDYHFETCGGQRVILFFFGRAQYTNAGAVLQAFLRHVSTLSAQNVLVLGVSMTVEDNQLSQLVATAPNVDLLWDLDGRLSRQCGVCQSSHGQVQYVPTSFLTDETLRVLQAFSLKQAEAPTVHVDRILDFLKQLPALEPHRRASRQAPVLLIPRAFELPFCQQLMQLLEANGGRTTGLLEEQDGQYVGAFDDRFKRRRDLALEQAGMDWVQAVQARIMRRIQPEVKKAFNFDITCFERPVIACYDSANQGFFARHRDNVTVEAANRRFAMTLNLNTGEYQGGELWFPEYGSHLFNPAAGEAVIFSCALMHQVTPVIQGKRYTFLVFFNERSPSDQTLAPPSQTTRKSNQAGLGFKPKPKSRRR